MICQIILFVWFLINTIVAEETDCPNAKRDKTLNLHSWKYYEDLNEMFFFYKNLSTGAWLMGSENNGYLSKGPATEEPILMTDGGTQKMFISGPLTIDMLVDKNLFRLFKEIINRSKGYNFDDAVECLQNEFKLIYDSIAWTAGSKATVEDWFSFRDSFANSSIGAAKEFYDKGGSITLKKDIIWITSVIHGVGELFKSNSGTLKRLVKENDLDFSEDKILNSETPEDAIDELLREISQVEDLSNVIGNKEEAKGKITSALKKFDLSDKETKESAESLVKKFYK